MKISYNGWDGEYQENREMYHILFDQAMVKEVEGSTEGLESAICFIHGTITLCSCS